MFRADETVFFDVQEASELQLFTVLSVVIFAIDILLEFSTILPTLGVQLNAKVAQLAPKGSPSVILGVKNDPKDYRRESNACILAGTTKRHGI